MTPRPLTVLALLAACLIVLVYWPGLQGPLLLDDFENLAPLSRFLDGQLSAAGVIFGNHSGLLGRPLSMASFVIDSQLWGSRTFGFKLTNLLLHVACAALVYALLARLLRRDERLADVRWLPLWLALLWAALPLHASIVLYVVQRMALLSALFTLAALLAYTYGRERIESGNRRVGAAWIWLAFPILVGLATLAKENGVLAVPLAAVIELFYFQPAISRRRPRVVTTLFALTLGLPILAAIALFALHPERLINGYAGRDFTLVERILTEPRVLWDYVSAILVPNGPLLGLFHDDYPISHGLLQPITTILAIAGWFGAICAAVALRKRAPTFAFGVAFFLAAHAMESTVLPLELYFEHRNYIASMGVLFAIADLATLALRRLGGMTIAMRRALLVLVFTIPATYLAATHARARVWSSEDTLYAQEEAHNPRSPRLNAILGARAMERGDLQASLRYIDRAERNGPTREYMTATVRRMLAHCVTARAVPAQLYSEAERRTNLPLTQYGMVAWEALAQRAETGECATDRARLAQIGIAWAQNSGLPANVHAAWRTRYNSARLLAASGQMQQAAELSSRAFQDSGNNFGVGVLAFQTCASLGEMRKCAPIARTLFANANPQDRQSVQAAKAFMDASVGTDAIVPAK